LGFAVDGFDVGEMVYLHLLGIHCIYSEYLLGVHLHGVLVTVLVTQPASSYLVHQHGVPTSTWCTGNCTGNCVGIGLDFFLCTWCTGNCVGNQCYCVWSG
jgi:hypothetical protein